MRFFTKAFAPIPPPEHGLGRALYDAGEWCCDNLSLFIAFIPATFLILHVWLYGP